MISRSLELVWTLQNAGFAEFRIDKNLTNLPLIDTFPFLEIITRFIDYCSDAKELVYPSYWWSFGCAVWHIEVSLTVFAEPRCSLC